MQLFLDLDGVIADFDQHCINLFGHDPRKGGISDSVFWDMVETVEDFWETIPVKFGAEDLMEVAAPYKPIFLTGVPLGVNGERAHAQKPVWVQKHIGDYQVITTMSRLKPTFMKNPGDILVDDRYRMIKKWEEAGGRGVIYKNPHESVEKLKKLLG